MSNHFRLFRQHLIFLFLMSWLVPSQAQDFQAASTDTPTFMASDTSIPAEEATNTTSPSFVDKNYISLQTELGRYVIASQQLWGSIPYQKKYKIGHRYQNAVLLRARLIITGDMDNDTAVDPALYDVALVEGIKHFQTRHGLNADGVPGKLTLTELNITPQERIRAIQVNMQRWSELSKELGDRYIMVNIPDYQFYLFDHGQQVLNMRAVVGKPDLQTPELSSRITRLVFNPYWNVPTKIAAKDLAPKVRADPYYLDDMHIKVFIRDSGHATQVNSQDIDWQNVQSGDAPYELRQDPGDDNALGLVKFEFPNPYDVYLHDTPAKSLFEAPFRALSHGCVRLERPFDLVEYLMKDDPKWSEEKFQSIMDSHKTTYISVSKPIPIYITYFTVWTDENGVVNYRDDIYKRDI